MFGICIESSHKKGLGHLFRMMNFATYLQSIQEKYIFIVNNDPNTLTILKSKLMTYELADLNDDDSQWEQRLIKKYQILYWINDRLNTHQQHALNIINTQTKLITFDDFGLGAKHSHINICGLFFHQDKIPGKKVLKGTSYLILNPEIQEYAQYRHSLNNILVTLGGSDTYGVTIKIVKLLKKYHIKATILTGPSFLYKDALKKELTSRFHSLHYVDSLIKEFSHYDLAITGGGITPFEANASGLPCLIIANEIFEIANGQYLDRIGSSRFLGFHDNINESYFNDMATLNIKAMSHCGRMAINTHATKKIFDEIKAL